jgi:hypothetical protein
MCKGPLLQKSQTQLLLAAFAFFVVAAGLVLWLPAVRLAIVVAIILGLTAAYLFVWSWLGKGRWCRTCKRFPIG